MCVHNLRFDTRADDEGLLPDLDGTLPRLEFREFSSSEQIRVVIEFAVEIARSKGEQRPPVVLID